jgi:hypothetical protein
MGSNSYGRDFGDSRVYYGYKKKKSCGQCPLPYKFYLSPQQDWNSGLSPYLGSNLEIVS